MQKAVIQTTLLLSSDVLQSRSTLTMLLLLLLQVLRPNVVLHSGLRQQRHPARDVSNGSYQACLPRLGQGLYASMRMPCMIISLRA